MSKSKGRQHISAQDLLKEMDSCGTAGYVHVLHPGNKRKDQWKLRYVILISNTLFVYEQHKSKEPKEIISLFGYNKVKRNDERDKEWDFCILSSLDSIRTLTLSCSSDREREIWMLAVKRQLDKVGEAKTPSKNDIYKPSNDLEQTYANLEKACPGPTSGNSESQMYQSLTDLKPVNESEVSSLASTSVKSTMWQRPRMSLPSEPAAGRDRVDEVYENSTTERDVLY